MDEPYAATPFWTLVRKRAGWLLVLFLGEMLTATAMGRFEEEIASAVVLALFVPLIISSGGNSGSQAASLIIRALAVGELRVRGLVARDAARDPLRAGRWAASSASSASCASACGRSSPPRPTARTGWLVAFTVWLSLVGVVLWGTVSGSMLPLILKRVGLDPAVSSAPFVATLVDVTGLVIYFEVAARLLRGTLL